LRKILLFGAGKSATVLIDYLLQNTGKENWQLTVVDTDIETAKSKIDNSESGCAISFDINNTIERMRKISEADIVISLLPPALHYLVATDCVELNKNLLTASYVDDKIKNLESEISGHQLLFLCEMGLDPGIDHMSAMKMIDEISEKGGIITSFKSHCGGLVAPENDDNPWRYKISWNPRSVVLAGKAGAHYKENGEEKHLKYEELFVPENIVEIPDLGILSWYPNRDSLSYASIYGLRDADTFVRTTLRYPDFIYGWKNLVDLKLTDETKQYETDGKTLFQVFKEHMDKNGFGKWLEQKLSERFSDTKEMLENLIKLIETEKEAKAGEIEIPKEFMTVDKKGELEEIGLDDVKNRAASFLAHKMHEANLTLKQLFYIGLDDDETIVNKGFCSPADVLQFALEKKLALKPDDKDMIVMMHEIGYKINDTENVIRSSLIVKGENNLRTAMAKTVGMPLGIAAKLILNGAIKLTGLHIPTRKEIYEPVLKELEQHGVRFRDYFADHSN
jgi:saccharopine dehydrogenase-like NADP-dependent oxidoreductase